VQEVLRQGRCKPQREHPRPDAFPGPPGFARVVSGDGDLVARRAVAESKNPCSAMTSAATGLRAMVANGHVLGRRDMPRAAPADSRALTPVGRLWAGLHRREFPFAR
jgi:hypothetical protein